ncbi:MAG: Methyltransferase type 12 [Myxococcaceae bacterium]|nr:Methyltransferase type 12 [Myxococcaceae bacterium]
MDLREAQDEGATRHPWEVARFQFFEEVLRGAESAHRDRSLRVLDVGSGDSWFAAALLPRLPEGSTIECWDAGYGDEDIAKSTPGITRTASKPSTRADVLLLLDVLEHVEDDRGFLDALVRENTHPGSTVLVSVPAWNALFTAHDTQLKHFRRYSPASAAALVEGAGLRIERQGGLFHSLLAPRGVSKLLEVTRAALGLPAAPPGSAAWSGGALQTKLVSAALAVDNRASHLSARYGLQVPGLSWWALCTTR